MACSAQVGARAAAHPPPQPVRADGHLFITVIAYRAVQIVRKRLAAAGDRASWTTLRNILAGQQRVTATFRRADGAPCTAHARPSLSPPRIRLRGPL